MKKCYCCGAKIEQDNAAFCPKCGKPLEVTAELTRRAAAGDSDAQTELYYRTYAAVYARIRAKVPDDDTAMDLMQDTYLRAFSHLEQLNEPAAFPGWILTIARSLTINWYKKHSKEKTTALFSESEFENEANLSAEDDESASTEYRIDFMPEESLDRAETARLVSEILDELPEEQKIVLLMRYTDEMSIEEIAEELGVSPNTVKTRLLRAKKKVEAKVLELERKGTKLYSLAPLPFLLFLLGNLENQAPNISAAQVLGTGAAAASTSATAGTTATTTAATSAGTTAATTAAATAGGVATKGLAVKVIAALLAVALVGGGGAAAYHAYAQAKEVETAAIAAAEAEAEEAAALAEAERQTEEEAQKPAEEAEAEAEAEEEAVQAATPTTATMEEMLGLTPRSIMTNCVTMTGTVTANQAVEFAAFAIRENRYSEDIVWADGWELLPTGSLEKYLQDLFGSSYEMSDYSGNSNYFTVDSAGQMYILGFDYSCEATTSIANISNTASEDGGFDVLARYQSTEEETVTGEKYVLYHVIPDDVSDYGWIIVSMLEMDNTGIVIERDTETAVSTDSEWAELYADYLESGSLSSNSFSGEGDYYLAYLNDDEVPELIYEKYFGFESCILFYIKDGAVNTYEVYMPYCSFVRGEGYLYSWGGKTGMIQETLLYLDNGNELSVMFFGSYEENWDGESVLSYKNYKCNEESVTETEYYERFGAACSGCSWLTVGSIGYAGEFSDEADYFGTQIGEELEVALSYLRNLTN